MGKHNPARMTRTSELRRLTGKMPLTVEQAEVVLEAAGITNAVAAAALALSLKNSCGDATKALAAVADLASVGGDYGRRVRRLRSLNMNWTITSSFDSQLDGAKALLELLQSEPSAPPSTGP